jgi:hypothetical protein
LCSGFEEVPLPTAVVETMFHNYFISMEKKSNIYKEQRQKKLFLFIFTLVQIAFKKWISLNQTLDIISNE